MSLIEKLRQKTPEEKIRFIWIVAGICTILLIGVWILTAKGSAALPKDTRLFQVISRGMKDISK